MNELTGFQKRYLRGLAHGLKPVVFVGQRGFTRSLAHALDDALDRHELIKIKFVEFKEKEEKQGILKQIWDRVPCEMVGMVGHIVTLYRRQPDPQKRKITLPGRAPD